MAFAKAFVNAFSRINIKIKIKNYKYELPYSLIMATYNFSNHLLKVSENKDNIEKAVQEWRFVTKEKYEKLSRICICQHKIKNVIYLFNTCTLNTIAVGSTCFKKFNVIIEVINPIIKKVLETLREKGEYKQILDFNKLIIDNEQDVIDSFQKEYRTYYNDIDELVVLQTYIYDLIHTYRVLYLNDTLAKFEKRIQELQKEKQEQKDRQERNRQEQKERQKKRELEEIYRKQQLKAKKKREYDEQQERQRIQLLEEAIKRERELCNCGLSLGSICKCKSPKYILIDLNKQFLCKICKNWKDRCK